MNQPGNIKKLKVVRIGNSAGVILPKDLLDKLGVVVGDQLSYNDTPEGIALSPRDDDFDEQMAAARKVMAKYRNALRELAK